MSKMNLIGLRFNDAGWRGNYSHFIVRRHLGFGSYEVEWFTTDGASKGLFTWTRKDILDTTDVVIDETHLMKEILKQYECLD